MAKHNIHNPINGKFAPKEPAASQPHMTGHRGGKSDTDRDMETNSQESQRYTAGRWDSSEDYDAAATDGVVKDKSADARREPVATSQPDEPEAAPVIQGPVGPAMRKINQRNHDETPVVDQRGRDHSARARNLQTAADGHPVETFLVTGR